MLVVVETSTKLGSKSREKARIKGSGFLGNLEVELNEVGARLDRLDGETAQLVRVPAP